MYFKIINFFCLIQKSLHCIHFHFLLIPDTIYYSNFFTTIHWVFNQFCLLKVYLHFFNVPLSCWKLEGIINYLIIDDCCFNYCESVGIIDYHVVDYYHNCYELVDIISYHVIDYYCFDYHEWVGIVNSSVIDYYFDCDELVEIANCSIISHFCHELVDTIDFN